MNRTKIKNFATLARKELHEQTETRLAAFGITRKGTEAAKDITGGLVIGGKTVNLSSQEKAQYQDLIRHVAQHGFEATVTEIAYTWFNRLSALRYMEVNGLMDHVLSSSTSGAYPDLLEHADTLIASGEFDGISVQDLEEWRGLNLPNTEEFIYRRLLGAKIRQLSRTLPSIFDSGEKPHLELFMPPNLLHTDSLLRKLVSDIPEEDWRDIEVIGWLYQFYISDKKDQVIGAKSKVKAEDIPAATQLFTPHWIVRYMVENSLGRLWLEHHPESQLRTVMPYFLENPEESPSAHDVRRVPLNEGGSVSAEHKSPFVKGEPQSASDAQGDLKPQDLKVLDPACGSGHILVYAFDLLFEIYREQGYPERDIPKMILEHNLFGLDIDERAAQLASFALVMKAAQKNRRILRNPPEVNVLQVKPTRFSPLFGAQAPVRPAVQGSLYGTPEKDSQSLFSGAINPKDWQALLYAFKDADNLGSLITPPEDVNYTLLHEQVQRLEQEGGLGSEMLPELKHYLKQADILRSKYHAVVANPPYMGSGSFNESLRNFIAQAYPENKADIFSPFMEKSLNSITDNGYLGMINQHSWMFLSSYQFIREYIVRNMQIINMIHLGSRAFPEIGGEVVQSTAFVLGNKNFSRSSGTYIRLVDAKDPYLKESLFLSKENRFYNIKQSDFTKIPGTPIAYWITPSVLNTYTNPLLEKYAFSDGKNVTSNNDRFVRYLWEVNSIKIGQKKKWRLYAKQSFFRKWHTTITEIVDRSDFAMSYYKKNSVARIINENVSFRSGITWADINTGLPSFRLMDREATFDASSQTIFFNNDEEILPALAALNSKPIEKILEVSNPTLHIKFKDVLSLPITGFDTTTLTTKIAKIAVELSKTDWDNFETSWDFQTHPLLRSTHPRIKDAFSEWDKLSSDAFYELKRLEEENNRYWIDAYGLQDELTPEVPEEQITIRKADLGRDVKSLLSYAVGCMMGRYSLDTPGLVHAGQPFDPGRHQKFPADADAILPVTTEAYFQDDLVTRFQEFLKVAYGPDHLSENLEFIADALGRKGNESALQTIRRYFVTEFASDHIQTYKKRPIYWLFTSGKRRAFNAFVYLHRYTPDTLARLRTDYVLELQTRLDAELARAEAEAASSSGAQKRAAESRIKNLKLDIEEVRAYQLKVQQLADQRIALDLDDGVAYNYTRFKGIVYEGTDLKMADLEKKAQWKLDLLKEQGLG